MEIGPRIDFSLKLFSVIKFGMKIIALIEKGFNVEACYSNGFRLRDPVESSVTACSTYI